MRATLLAVGLASLCVACGGDDQTMDMDMDMDILDPPPPPGGQQLTTTEFTVAQGEERFLCYTFHSPAEAKAITHISPIQDSVVHHVVLFKTMTPEQEGSWECPQLISLNWEPIWAIGAGGAEADLPEGVGFVVEPDTQYLVQYHLQNTGEADLTTRAALNLTYTNAEGVQPAGIFALGTFDLTIPNGAHDFPLEITCNASRQMNVFAVFPHMHKLGQRLTFETGPSAEQAEMAYEIGPWTFGEQPMDPVELSIEPGQFLKSTCFWTNETGADVTFGESSDNEMCFFVLFYYPFTQLDGCVN